MHGHYTFFQIDLRELSHMVSKVDAIVQKSKIVKICNMPAYITNEILILNSRHNYFLGLSIVNFHDRLEMK